MREEPKSLAEWLEAHGNPKHSIADGEKGSKVLVVEDNSDLFKGVTLYNFTETEYPDGHKYFWMSSGWGVRKEFLPVLKKYLTADETSTEPELLKFEVWEWFDDEAKDEACERCIDVIKAVSEWHAKAQLKSGIKSGKYHEGMWLEHNGKKIELDVKAVAR
jgi:hypothetical protein